VVCAYEFDYDYYHTMRSFASIPIKLALILLPVSVFTANLGGEYYGGYVRGVMDASRVSLACVCQRRAVYTRRWWAGVDG
jgi:hypothetical protein